MICLIIDDNALKTEQLATLVKETVPDVQIETRRSYQSGLKYLLSEHADLVLLDMTMPTYDVTVKEKGGRQRAFAGRDILDELKRRSIVVPVVIATQFETFGDDKKSLSQLCKELENDFPDIYLGTIYYNTKLSEWRDSLIRTSLKLANNLEEPND